MRVNRQDGFDVVYACIYLHMEDSKMFSSHSSQIAKVMSNANSLESHNI